MGNRRRLLVFAVVLVVAASVSGIAIARAVTAQRQQRIPTAATARDRTLPPLAVLAVPHIVFRSTSPGPTYGLVAAVPLAAPQGARSVTTMSCQRVYSTGPVGLCLITQQGMLTTYRAQVLGPDLAPVRALPLAGVPSRARVSPDGSLAADTVFLTGHSYTTVGFSTETTIYDLPSGTSYGNLEKVFRTLVDGQQVTAADLNVWGVTFPPGPHPRTFYATAASGGTTWLVRGDLDAKTLTALHTDAECPSLSPDGRTIVYKKRNGSPATWRYYGYDIATGKEWPLAETRSIDDQAAWLNNGTVIYGLQRPGTGQSDVWQVPLHGGAPSVLIPDAWSPAVVTAS